MNRGMSKARIGVLLSGRGSNFQAILQAIEIGALQPAEITVVISNQAAAPGLVHARQAGIPTAVAKTDAEILLLLQTHQVHLVVLAGYMKLVTPVLLEAYPNRILNIHPSLLPAYGGMGMYGTRVHQAVLQAKEPISGCSVHLVTEVVDGGAVLGQRRVPVFPEDTPELLAERVLAQEHQLYPEVLQTFIQSPLFQEALVAHDAQNSYSPR